MTLWVMWMMWMDAEPGTSDLETWRRLADLAANYVRARGNVGSAASVFEDPCCCLQSRGEARARTYRQD